MFFASFSLAFFTHDDTIEKLKKVAVTKQF